MAKFFNKNSLSPGQIEFAFCVKAKNVTQYWGGWG